MSMDTEEPTVEQASTNAGESEAEAETDEVRAGINQLVDHVHERCVTHYRDSRKEAYPARIEARHPEKDDIVEHITVVPADEVDKTEYTRLDTMTLRGLNQYGLFKLESAALVNGDAGPWASPDIHINSSIKSHLKQRARSGWDIDVVVTE